DFSLRLSETLSDTFESEKLRMLLDDVEIPLATVLARMEIEGVGVDGEFLKSLADQAEIELNSLEKKCIELAGHEFNVGSPRQLETILFDELNLPVLKKTKTARSTDQSVLEELALLHPLPQTILEYRGLSKLKSTYLDALPLAIDPNTGRIHTKFNQAVAATGRLSSSDPNLQNIPIRTEMGRRVRDGFIAKSGHELLSADYSQIELRVLAHLSQDPELLDAYRRGIDVHARTAAALFDKAESDVKATERAQGKTVNFAVIYGQTQFALARNLGIERSEAKRYIDAFFARYAGVDAYLKEVVQTATETGYVETMLGRRRPMPDLRSKNHQLRSAAERVARNTPIQGTAADIIKLAMIRADKAIAENNLDSKMILSVHDELVFEAPQSERDALQPLVVSAMQNAMHLSVPLVVQTGWGKNWGAAH
ncbi:MAG: DNA polymerase I, partial [Polyangiales bacterium]